MDPGIVLVGEESAGMRLLRGLHARGSRIVMVLSQGPVGWTAADLGYEVRPASRVTDPRFAEEIAGADLLLNAHSLHIVAPEVLDVPTVGALNVHPGPLPEFAGLNTPCWAIYEGAEEYGVTVHWMVPEVDAGPVAARRRWPLSGDEIALDVWSRCSREGVELALELTEAITRGTGPLPARPQDLSRRRYYGRRPPLGGRISWEMTAGRIERFARASDFGPFESPWSRPVAEVRGREVHVLEATVLEGSGGTEPGTAERLSDDRFLVAAADRWVDIRARAANG